MYFASTIRFVVEGMDLIIKSGRSSLVTVGVRDPFWDRSLSFWYLGVRHLWQPGSEVTRRVPYRTLKIGLWQTRSRIQRDVSNRMKLCELHVRFATATVSRVTRNLNISYHTLNRPRWSDLSRGTEHNYFWIEGNVQCRNLEGHNSRSRGPILSSPRQMAPAWSI